jgi:hypothetical protein
METETESVKVKLLYQKWEVNYFHFKMAWKQKFGDISIIEKRMRIFSL